MRLHERQRRLVFGPPRPGVGPSSQSRGIAITRLGEKQGGHSLYTACLRSEGLDRVAEVWLWFALEYLQTAHVDWLRLFISTFCEKRCQACQTFCLLVRLDAAMSAPRLQVNDNGHTRPAHIVRIWHTVDILPVPFTELSPEIHRPRSRCRGHWSTSMQARTGLLQLHSFTSLDLREAR